MADCDEEEFDMFKIIGGGVVFGFALYGLIKCLDRPKVRPDLTPRLDDEAAARQKAPEHA